ncbi:MAG: DUF3754 domain-containing protein [Planctomycetota bacterium]|nr:DUF3754 domain-containing protein [Planctomycetota bacterium]
MTHLKPTDHSIPASLERVTAWLAAEQPSAGSAPAASALRLLTALLRLESTDRADTLKSSFAATIEAGAVPSTPTYDAFVAALHELLGRANYREISGAELQEAFDSEALSSVKIQVDMTAFAALHIFARGKERRAETVRSLFGLRKRRVEFDVLERVFVFSSLAQSDGALNLKLFGNIPVPDMEMLLPNCKVKMRRIDQAVVFLPATISVVLAASKVLLSLTAIWSAIQFYTGLSKDEPIVSGGWGLVAAGSFTLLGITMGAYTKYQKRRLEYANAHSRTLYFQTLDSESGAFLRVLDEAFEEEAKEAVLAYAFLVAHGPSTEQALDERVERWLHTKIGAPVDFEVDDALAKLARLGVATRTGDVWTAMPAETATERLRAQWVGTADR